MSTLQRDLRASLGDGAFHSLMVGMGETYLAAFALALHAGEIASGLLVAVPMLAGALLQLAAPPLIGTLGSHRTWVAGCAACQAASLLMLPCAIVSGEWAVALLYLAATVYWAAGQASGPAWSTWIESLVPPELRARFFARRARICQLGTLLGFVGGGCYLDYGYRNGFRLNAFAMVLLAAAISRLLSAWCLFRHSEPAADRDGDVAQRGLRQVLGSLPGHEGARLCLYLFAVQVAVQISGPYFAPFMLAKLKLSYTEFMFLVALGFVGKALGLPTWGKLAQRHGPRLLMWIGGISITPLAGLWFALPWLDQPMPYLAVIQVAGGVGWAAYELAFFLMFFETIPRHERISVLTLYNVGNASATAVGALLGAIGLSLLGEAQSSYLLLFVLSSACRVAALVVLAQVPRMQLQEVVPKLRLFSPRRADARSPAEEEVLPANPQRPAARRSLSDPEKQAV